MAHEKVYGICENKCKVEVYSKGQADTKFSAPVIFREIYLLPSGEKTHVTKTDTAFIDDMADVDANVEEIEGYTPVTFIPANATGFGATLFTNFGYNSSNNRVSGVVRISPSYVLDPNSDATAQFPVNVYGHVVYIKNS